MADWNTTATQAIATIATVTTYTDREACALTAKSNERTISQRWKNPSRSVSVNIPATPWDQMVLEIPETYRPVISAVLESAAKSILKRHVEAYSTLPAQLPVNIFSFDALMTEAQEGNSDWMTKEELQSAWEQSTTRKMFLSSPNYAASAGYRKAVAYYSDLILKLAGKTSSYKPDELDIIVAKLNEQDAHTELGAFICKRVEQLRNKPARNNDVNIDLL